MARLTERKIILIHRETRLDGLIRRHNTKDQAAFFIQSRGDRFNDYLDEDKELKQALAVAQSLLNQFGRVQLLERSFLPNFLFGPEDLIVVAGQDGLVANTLKYLKGQPLIAVNPAPQRFDGQLLPFKITDINAVVKAVLNNQCTLKSVTMAQAQLNDGQTLLAVNDLYIGPRLPISARYEIELDGEREVQSSSGVLVSTGLGSTGWLRSLITGAAAITQTQFMFDDEGVSAEHYQYEMPWDTDELCYCVREPFPSHTTGTSLVFGRIAPSQHFALSSKMAEGGIIFSDGIVDDAIEFNSGSCAVISVAPMQGKLVAV